MVSVVGGLYGLNLIPLWRPTRLTFFDINPTAVTYFRMIHRLFLTSDNVDHLLRRLTEGDYDAETESEEFVRENIRLKQQGCLPRSRGSTKRSYPESWKIAFDHFDLTKQILREVPLEIRTVPMESESFSRWIREQNNLWIYCSNITQFHFFDLEFADPTNVVAGADHPSRTTPASGPGAAERRARPGPLRDSTEGGAHRTVIPTVVPSRFRENTHMANKIRIQTNAASPALGTYSQAIRTGDLVFVTGQTGRDPETGKLEEGLESQTRRVLANIDAILNAAGCSNADIVKVTLLLADIKDFKAVDQIYAAWLPGHGVTPAKPARTAFQAAALPAGALLMLEVVAACPE